MWKKATERYSARLKETAKKYYFEEEVSRLNNEIEQFLVKGPNIRKQKYRRLQKHHRKVNKDFLPQILKPFVESFHHLPKLIVADAGYGSEEKSTYLNANGIEYSIKYN